MSTSTQTKMTAALLVSGVALTLAELRADPPVGSCEAFQLGCATVDPPNSQAFPRGDGPFCDFTTQYEYLSCGNSGDPEAYQGYQVCFWATQEGAGCE